MSDNTSAVAYLRNQGGHQIARNERLATELCLWSEKRGMTLVPCYLLVPLKVLADHLSRRDQILKTDWSLNQTVADRIFRAWGRPFVDLFALGKNTKLAIYVSPVTLTGQNGHRPEVAERPQPWLWLFCAVAAMTGNRVAHTAPRPQYIM